MDHARDILDLISATQARQGEPFALATVVRTVAATAAKAGAKAVILPDGTISEGWIGGGCARAAVLKAAREALADGKSRLVSVQPPDALQDQGVAAGEERAGVRFVKNMCPSQGTDGHFRRAGAAAPATRSCAARARWRSRSPISARRIGFALTVCAPAARAGELRRGRPADRRLSAAGRGGGRALRGHRDARARRRGRAAGRAVGRRPTMSRSSAAAGRPKSQGEARGGRRRARTPRPAEGAGRSRSRRDHAGRDRALDPGRNRCGAAQEAKGQPRRDSAARCRPSL